MKRLACRPDALVKVLGPPYSLPGTVVEHLRQISGLTWQIVGGYFHYGWKGITGWAAYPCGSQQFSEFEIFVLKEQPTKFQQIHGRLRRES